MTEYKFDWSKKYKLSDYELSEPLSEEDSQRLESYNDRIMKQGAALAAIGTLTQQIAKERRKPTVAEQKQLAELQEQRNSCVLDRYDEADWERLRTRRYWREELENYRWELTDSAFAQFNPPLSDNLLGGFNLPAMIEEFERAKAVCSTPGARQSLARRKRNYIHDSISQLEQDDSELWHHIDPVNNLGETKRAILGEVLIDLFSQFLQYVEQELPDVPVLPASNEVSTDGHGLINTAGSSEQSTTIAPDKLPLIRATHRAPQADYAEALSGLFVSGFTIEHCDALMHINAINIKAAENRNAKIWALADILEKYHLINCTAAKASRVAGGYHGYEVKNNSASHVRNGKDYKAIRAKLETKVKNAIANKVYG